MAGDAEQFVVIYMGLKKVTEIAPTYREIGATRPPPWCSTPLCRSARSIGRVAELPALVAAQGITCLVIVFIGDVVGVGCGWGNEPCP